MIASAYFPQREGQLKLPPLPPSSSDGDLGYLSNNSDGGVGNSHGQGMLSFHFRFRAEWFKLIRKLNLILSLTPWSIWIHIGIHGGEGGGEAILAKFCHSCGTRFPISWARFCCMCGEKRLYINPADKLPPIWSMKIILFFPLFALISILRLVVHFDLFVLPNNTRLQLQLYFRKISMNHIYLVCYYAAFCSQLFAVYSNLLAFIHLSMICSQGL